MCTEKYVSPFTDFGFKRLFGSEESKEFMISFLNSLLTPDSPIVEIEYGTQERLGISEGMRNAIFDIYCETGSGERIIVEMQNMYQKFFVDRSIFYSTFPIQEAAVKGRWDFNLPDVYTISFLDFTLDKFRGTEEWKHTIRLCDVATGKEFSEKLTYIYLELPKYQKNEDELITPLDEWIYLIKHVNYFEEVPERFSDGLYERFLAHARLSGMTENERRAYEESLRELRDYTNTISTAEERGHQRGRREGLEAGRREGLEAGRREGLEEGFAKGEKAKSREIARRMLALGMSRRDVARATGLNDSEF